MDGLRRRLQPSPTKSDRESPPVHEGNEEKAEMPVVKPGTYWLTRIVLLRYLAFIYFVAFLVGLHQNEALIGSNGLLPAQTHMSAIRSHAGNSSKDLFSFAPTLLWLFDFEQNLNWLLNCLAFTGLALSAFVMLFGCANMVVMATLWILYHSIVNVGQRWYGFGWESQLLESGFLAIFLCPVLSFRRVPPKTATPWVVIWGYRWLIFRIMFGAGLIKIWGDQCWLDLTCMHYHYQTQPVPNPISYYLHQSPDWFHKFETLTNHFVELPAPFLLLLTRRCRMLGGAIQIMFQVVLIISGNLSFLNWLTILPSLACFDDAALAWMFSSKRGSAKHQVVEIQRLDICVQRSTRGQYIRRVSNWGLAALLVYLSVPVVHNLLSPKQAMNTSFEPLRILNTYGAFGSVTKERTEVIFQGTLSDKPLDPGAIWQEYQFKCKPGDVSRRPCLISPYHYRLDWLMWFAAFQNYQYNPWLVHLAAKFLVNDPATMSLISTNPFEGKSPPKFVRAEHYRYSYTKLGSKSAAEGKWWTRRRLGNYLPPVSLDSLQDFMRHMGWRLPRLPA